MIVFFLVMGLIIWASLQGRESRQVVWAARFEALSLRVGPVVRYVAEDIRSVRNHIRTARIMRQTKKRGWE